MKEKNPWSKLPIHSAITQEPFDLNELKTALKETKDVNARDEYGNTPLHLAIQKNLKEAVDLLLKTPGIDIHLTTTVEEDTPLHLAVREYCPSYGTEVITTLVKAGAKTDATNHIGQTPKSLAKSLLYGGIIIRALEQKPEPSHSSVCTCW